jgi:HEAT repeat protein
LYNQEEPALKKEIPAKKPLHWLIGTSQVNRRHHPGGGKAMGLFGPPNIIKMEAKRDVEGLIKALRYRRDKKDEYRHVAQAAADALGYIGDVRAIEPLIVALEVSHLGENALSALRKFGALTVEPLITALKHNDKKVRRYTATVLGEIRDARAVEPLIAALKDIDSEVCEAAAKALGEIGDVRAIEPLIAAFKDIDCKEAVAEALVLIGDVRAAAWPGSLRKFGAPAVEPLITALKHNKYYVRKGAATLLGNIGDVRAVEPLIAALEDIDRQETAEALGWIGDVHAFESLIAAFKQEAAEALGEIGDVRAVEPLIAALKVINYGDRRDVFGDHKVASVCGAVAWALGNIGDVRAVEPLIAAFKEISRTFRDDVMNRRARGKVETIIQSVTPGDDTWSVWKYPLNAAAEALVTLGDFRAIEPLFAVLDDLDDKVRAGARALRQSLGVHAVEAHQTTLEQLDQAERANDLYVNECFTIEFPETRENRQLLDTAEAQPMIAAQHSGALADSLLHAQRLVMRYPDCHSFYYWQGYLHAELGHLGQSRAILLEGIQKSREKASLYDRLARTEWQSGDLQEAVKWWIRSMVVRTETRNFDDSDPFLYLSYVAEGLGLSDASAKLSQKSKTSLGSEAAAKLRNAAVSQGTQSMKDAILRACRDLA